MKITRIAYKAKMNCGQLKSILGDLIQKKLAEERILEKSKVVYAATPRARTILSHFEEIRELLPIVEDDKLTFGESETKKEPCILNHLREKPFSSKGI